MSFFSRFKLSMKGQNFVEHLAEICMWTFPRLLDFNVVPPTGGPIETRWWQNLVHPSMRLSRRCPNWTLMRRFLFVEKKV